MTHNLVSKLISTAYQLYQMGLTQWALSPLTFFNQGWRLSQSRNNMFLNCTWDKQWIKHNWQSIILIIIIIFIYCNWVVTRWQWLFYMYTKHEIVYAKHEISEIKHEIVYTKHEIIIIIIINNNNNKSQQVFINK